MTEGKLVAKSGAVIIDSCMRTTNIFDRLRGLLFRPTPAPNAGLLIDPCNSVHTFFMSYAIDVIYLDRDFRIVKLIENLSPWRISACRSAHMTLEVAASQARHLGLSLRSQLQWQTA